MPKKDFGKEVRDSLQDKVNAVRQKVGHIDAAEVKENIRGAFETVKDKVAETGGKANAQMKKWLQKEEAPQERPDGVSVQNALKIIYYLMAADGEIFHGEEEKFDAIGKELDPDFAQTKTAVVDECKARLSLGAETYGDVLRAGVDYALSSADQTEDTFISPKLLVWDLLTVAYSDENCDEAEQSLIDHAAKRLKVDKAIYLELQSSILSMLDLEKELAWIKTTDRPYLTIEAHVNEINKRKTAIMESVAALIAL